MSIYHTRQGYEDLLVVLSKHAGTAVPLTSSIRKLTDYQLLCMLNLQLIKLDLVPLDEDELKMELTTSVKTWR